MKQTIYFLFLCIVIFNNGLNAEEVRIKAYVNDDVITNVDIANRQKILMRIGNIRQNENDILDTLIDEIIVLQIAKKNNHLLSDEQLVDLQNNLAVQAGFQNFGELINKFNIDPDSLRMQLECKYLVGYFIEHYIKPNIEIDEYQIQSNLPGLIDNHLIQKEHAELNLSQLVLDQDHENKEEIITKIQNDLKKKIPFSSIAKHYSNLEVSDLGDLKINQLQEPIRQFLIGKKVGDIIGPIFSDKKILFIHVNDMKFHKLSSAQVRKLLYQSQLIRKVREFIIKFREEVFIKII